MTPLLRYNERAAFPLVASIGFYDGVHLGHRHLLAQVTDEARRRGMGALAVTFAGHPLAVVRGGQAPRLLSTPEEKAGLLRDAGLDAVAMLRFTPALAALTSRQFMEQVLRRDYGVRVLVVGYDHRFGSDRGAGLADYRRYGAACGVEVVEATRYAPDGAEVSSSAVRRLLAAGDAEAAARLLGRPYELGGTVVAGRQVGRRLGYPTANLRPASAEKLLPAAGVYAAEAETGGVTCAAMLNIGLRPTLDDGRGQTVEAHLLDFDGDLYGRPLTLRFVRRLRGERQFGSLEQLRAQLAADEAEVRRRLLR